MAILSYHWRDKYRRVSETICLIMEQCILTAFSLIAIMLGRLRMSIDDCIEAYSELSEKVFRKKHTRIKLSGAIQGRFDTAALPRQSKSASPSLVTDWTTHLCFMITTPSHAKSLSVQPQKKPATLQ